MVRPAGLSDERPSAWSALRRLPADTLSEEGADLLTPDLASLADTILGQATNPFGARCN
jgi:hypothetical protein